MAKKKEPKYTREAILRTPEFLDSIQKDFLVALLPKEEYTLSEVRQIITEFYQKGRE